MVILKPSIFNGDEEAVTRARFIETSCKGIGVRKKKADTIFSALRRAFVITQSSMIGRDSRFLNPELCVSADA